MSASRPVPRLLRPIRLTVLLAGAVTALLPATAGAHACVRLHHWSVRRQAAQLVAAPVQEGDLLVVKPLVTEGIGGLLLFGSSAPATLPGELAHMGAAAMGRIAPLVMTDEEGGEVQRMANLVGSLPWPREMASRMTPAQVKSLARRVGEKMRAAGVNTDLAPVLDLSNSPGPDARYPDGPRSFSANPSSATAYGLAFARGLLAGGVTPVVKHFPGLGQASYNTDYGPASDPPLSVLRKGALRPFKAAITAGLPAVMIGNVSVPGLTGRLPASLSGAAITRLLRGRLGFRGLVLTDSLSAAAIADAGYTLERAAPRAIEAGADMVLFGATQPVATANAVIRSIVAAASSGALSRPRLKEAVRSVLRAKGISICPADLPGEAESQSPRSGSAAGFGLLSLLFGEDELRGSAWLAAESRERWLLDG